VELWLLGIHSLILWRDKRVEFIWNKPLLNKTICINALRKPIIMIKMLLRVKIMKQSKFINSLSSTFNHTFSYTNCRKHIVAIYNNTHFIFSNLGSHAIALQSDKAQLVKLCRTTLKRQKTAQRPLVFYTLSWGFILLASEHLWRGVVHSLGWIQSFL